MLYSGFVWMLCGAGLFGGVGFVGMSARWGWLTV